ncbi:hypothetical protein MASR1M60_17660 [Rhodocyclaceae bacterium]
MYDVRDILRDNILTLMRESANCQSQNAAARHAREKGLSGVKQTTLGTLIRPKDQRGPSYPKLNTLESIAALFGIGVGELLSKDLGRRPPPPGAQPSSGPPLPPDVGSDRLITETIGYMEASSPTGRAIVHDKARDIAREYPALPPKR